jgi:thiamine-phosphate pyrophosphorylase
MISLGDRSLYLCTPLRDDLDAFLRSCLDGGVDIVQLREKDASAHARREGAELCRSICHEFNVPFIVNDDPELALAVGADGVHVGQDDQSVATCRGLLGPDVIVGLSTHAEDELLDGTTQAVTYLSAGPVEATPTKPGRRGTGIEYIEFALRHAEVPVFVTGGVTPESVATLGAYGVRHFVVVRSLTQATDPRRQAEKLRLAIDLL